MSNTKEIHKAQSNHYRTPKTNTMLDPKHIKSEENTKVDSTNINTKENYKAYANQYQFERMADPKTIMFERNT